MSVYTKIKRKSLILFLNDYSVGNLISYEGINDGIENTNYFVTTDKGKFVLTLFEQHKFSELSYFIDVIAFFYKNNIPTARPIADIYSNYIKNLCGKPATLVIRLSGQNIKSVTTLDQCTDIGTILGRMHIIAKNFHLHRTNEHDLAWCHQIAHSILPLLDNQTSMILRDELKAQAKCKDLYLPSGLTHSDLFRDNVLFKNNKLRGIIDFYHACDEYLIYDLAVTVNDWCIDETGLIEESRYQVLMAAYSRQRTLTKNEWIKWNSILRVAALRFWCSRLRDKFFPRKGVLTKIKDPDDFLKILLQHRNQTFYL